MIEAKNSMTISFKLHKINTEIIKAVIDRKLVCFNLSNYFLDREFAYLEAKRINLSNSSSEFQL